MVKWNMRSFVVLAAIIFLATGCVSNKRHTRDVNALQTQVNTLATEVARIDIQKAPQPGAVSVAPAPRMKTAVDFTSTAVYRTPSGFELPAADIQSALKSAGYYDGEVDGKIGPKTRDAIRAFQRDHNLKADGVCGKKTWEQLKSYLSSSAIK